MLHILIGALVLFVFGAAWYTVLFGKLWARLNGFDRRPDPNFRGMAKSMTINFLVNILPMFSLYFIYPRVTVVSFDSFWKIVMVVCLGFTLPVYVNAAIWERKPWSLVVLNSVYTVISYTISAAIVYNWPM